MLYLHCGWPRTGTSSLQAALDECRATLAEAGILYPREWRLTGREADPAHHGLGELMNEGVEAKQARARFQDYLRSHPGAVLASSESISNWVFPPAYPALRRWLESVREVTDLKCLWTLRRMDEFFISMYLNRFQTGFSQTADEYIVHRLDSGWIDGHIRAMEMVTSDPNWETAVIRYRPGGEHLGELLAAAAFPESARERVIELVAARPRRGGRLTHKAAIAVVHRDSISKRIGTEISADALTRALHRGDLVFAEDSPFQVVDTSLRRRVHGEALSASRSHGFGPYLEFYEDDEIGDDSVSSLDLDLLTEDDLEAIAAIAQPGAVLRSG